MKEVSCQNTPGGAHTFKMKSRQGTSMAETPSRHFCQPVDNISKKQDTLVFKNVSGHRGEMESVCVCVSLFPEPYNVTWLNKIK